MANDFYSASGFVPEVFSKKLALAERNQTNFKERMCNREWEGEIKRFGDVVHISLPDPDDITIGTASGSTKVCPTASDVTPTKKDLTINKVAYFQFYFNDVEQAQVQFDIIEGYGALAVQKMGDERSKEIEQAILDSSAVPGLSTATAPADFNETNAFRQMTKLRTQLLSTGAILANGFYAFKGNQEETKMLRPIVTMGPAVYEVLLNSKVLTHPTVAGDDILKTGERAMVAGFEIDVDLQIDKTTYLNASTPTALPTGVYPVIAGTKMGVTYADQYTKVEKLRDVNCFGDIVRGIQLYGFEIIHPKSLVKAYYKVSEDTTTDITINAETVNVTEAGA